MTAVLERLQRWRDAGWLRPLDRAFAAFLHQLDAQAPPSLLLAAAWLAHLEAQGHSGLPLAGWRSDALEILGWPAEAASELAQALAELPADAASARQSWAGTPLLQIEPADERGSSPLVLCDDRLSLRRYWRYESRIAAQLMARCRVDAAEAVDTDAARAQLERLFPPSTFTPDWQQLACALALRARLTLITGGPGTGKTFTAARLLVLLQALHSGPQPLRLAMAAPTGKAAARLRQSIELALQSLPQEDGAAPLPIGPARTLHALLGARPGTRRFRHDAANPLDLDLLFVDEASMVHLEMMAALLDALPATARLVLLGDKDQLASVEAGAVLGELCRGSGYDAATASWLRALTGQGLPDSTLGDGDALVQQTVTLRQSRRFAGAIGRLAQAVNAGDGAGAVALLREAPPGELALIETRDPSRVVPQAVAGYRPFVQALAERPASAAAFDDWARRVLGLFDGFRVLCALREGPWGVAGWNEAIERTLAAQGLLQRRGEWYAGRPVMVTRNDASLGVFNGDIGIVLAAPGGERLRAYFLDGAALRSVAVGRLAEVETAFAMTVHKSQGSEFAQVMLVLPDEDSALLTRELVYTAITRARMAFTLVASDAGRLARACARLTRRLGGLAALRERAAARTIDGDAGATERQR